LATALLSTQSYPALPPPRVTALRPVSAGDAGTRSTGSSERPQIEAESLREDELYRLRPESAESHSAGAGASRQQSRTAEDDQPPGPATPAETPSFPGGTSAFLTQLLAQEEPAQEHLDPFGDATRAYERFHEERDANLFIDVRDPVDVNI
jgi:hypothetical protein